MSAQHVRIRLDAGGHGMVEIDGVDLAGVTSSTRIITEAGKPPRLELCIWCELLEVEGPVAEVVKLIESAVDAADAPVIGITEHGDRVFPVPAPAEAPE